MCMLPTWQAGKKTNTSYSRKRSYGCDVGKGWADLANRVHYFSDRMNWSAWRARSDELQGAVYTNTSPRAIFVPLSQELLMTRTNEVHFFRKAHDIRRKMLAVFHRSVTQIAFLLSTTTYLGFAPLTPYRISSLLIISPLTVANCFLRNSAATPNLTNLAGMTYWAPQCPGQSSGCNGKFKSICCRHSRRRQNCSNTTRIPRCFQICVGTLWG